MAEDGPVKGTEHRKHRRKTGGKAVTVRAKTDRAETVRIETDKAESGRREGLNGYFTVEASLLLPAVILLFAFIFYLTFFLYNRCVLTQDAYALAFRGSLWCGREPSEVQERVEEQMRRQPPEKYPALGDLERNVEATAKKVRVRVQGGMRIPKKWRFDFYAEAHRECPVKKIRRIRRMYHTYQKIRKEKTEQNKQ